MYNRRWGQDRRRFQRLNLNLTVWYQHLNQQLASAEREATTLDISPFGIAFKSDYDIPVHSDLALKLIIFGCENGRFNNLVAPLEVSGKVRSCSLLADKAEYRVGVAFINMELTKQLKIAHFIRESMRSII